MQVRVLNSIKDAGKRQWNTCFSGEPEDYAYLLAIEESGMKGFSWRYVTAWSEGTLVAAMPAFMTDYRLDTTLDGAGKKVTGALCSIFPNMLTMKLACLGSPDTEYGLVGFHPSVDEPRKKLILREMVAAFEEHAAQEKHSLIGLKDIPGFHEDLWREVLTSLNYRGVPGLPVAGMDITFGTLDEYFAGLSYGTRKDMRRKLRSLSHIRIEYRDNIDDVLDKVMGLYRDTRGRSDMQFEELTPQFFQNVLRGTEGRAICTLYFVGRELLAANLLLNNGRMLLDKFFCMDGDTGREHNLYFLSWITNIRYCLDHGLRRYQSGQAAYENKLRLGCGLTRTTMYFRHKNQLLQGALRLVSPLLAADDTDALLKKRNTA